MLGQQEGQSRKREGRRVGDGALRAVAKGFGEAAGVHPRAERPALEQPWTDERLSCERGGPG